VDAGIHLTTVVANDAVSIRLRAEPGSNVTSVNDLQLQKHCPPMDSPRRGIATFCMRKQRKKTPALIRRSRESDSNAIEGSAGHRRSSTGRET
jgi:hypothetical protein